MGHCGNNDSDDFHHMCVSSRELLTYSKNIKYNLFEKLSVVTLLSAQEWLFNVN